MRLRRDAPSPFRGWYVNLSLGCVLVAQTHTRQAVKGVGALSLFAMTGTYENVSGVELSEWEQESDEPDEQRHCKLEEMYFESYNGDLVIRFVDRDTNRTFDLSIPVKADENWNDLVESLPRWDL